MKKFLISIVLFGLLSKCNMREQCKASSGYENYDGCAIFIGFYNNLPEERKIRVNVDGILGACLLTHIEIERCNKESTRWPLPD